MHFLVRLIRWVSLCWGKLIVSSMECVFRKRRGVKGETPLYFLAAESFQRLSSSELYGAVWCHQCSTWLKVKSIVYRTQAYVFAILKEATQSCDRLRNKLSQTVRCHVLCSLWAHSPNDFFLIKRRRCRSAPSLKNKHVGKVLRKFTVTKCLH